MEDKSSEKSRRERRKEARQVKSKKKFDSWVQHQFHSLSDYLRRDMEGIKMSATDDLAIERRLAKKLKVKNGTLGAASDDLENLLEGIPSVLDSIEKVHKSAEDSSFSGRSDDMNSVDEDLDDEILSEEEDEESDSIEDSEEYDGVLDLSSLKKANGKTKPPNSAEHRGSEIKDGKSFAERCVTTERGSAKGVSPVLDSEDNKRTHTPDDSSKKNLTNSISGKYIAPHLRSNSSNESAEYAQVRNRLRGLLNRLSETNLEGITREISTLFHSVGRNVGCQIITEEVVASCSGGPRGNEQYAAVFAAFVAGMACLVGIDFGAKLLARLAKCFEEEHMKADNVSLRNLTLLLCYLYVFGLCSSELMYDFLIMLGKRLTEVDVSTVLTVLQCCGMKLRGDDPVGMKNFISSVQCSAGELKDSSRDEKSNITNKRMEFMIETICDIKNNKKRTKEDNVQHTRINKWLQKLRVEDVLILGLTWSKLLDPGKKGQWWLIGEMSSTNQNIEEVASSIDKEIPETVKMLDLAASQRMNTDARRAIFCVIMSSEDYLDAFEKLLRLDLPGKQDREIMRVLVECCLQEKVFNKYYCILASKLCSHDKNHKFTLQYCLWDHFKELDSMQLIRSVHLSKFTAEMIASFSLSLAVLKAVDLNDPVHLSPKRIMHFRMLFEALFELPDKLVWNIFTRIAATPEYESVRSGIEFFVSKYVVTSNKSLANKLKIARKALRNVEGIVM